MALNLLIAALTVVSPLVIKRVVDDVIALQRPQDLPPYLALIVAVAVLGGLARFAYAIGKEQLGQTVITDMRTALYSKLLALHFGFYDGERTGSLMSRMIGDVESTRVFLSGIIIDTVYHVTTIVLLLGAFTQQDLLLAIIAIVPCALSALGLYQLFIARKGIHAKIHEENANVSATLQDSLSGIKVVKAYAQEQQELGKFTIAIDRQKAINFLGNWTWNTRFPFVNSLQRFMVIALLAVGGLRVMNGEITLGTLVAALSFGGLLMVPFAQLGQQLTTVGQTAAAALRIFRLLDEPIGIQSPEFPKPMTDVRGEIEFKHVTFRYAGSTTRALDDINLLIPAGTSLALVGTTGSGKTSLAQLIGRLYDPTSGQVLIDGVDARQLDMHELRRQIGTVAQDSLLFSDTIANNIAFGRSDAPRDAIIRAATLSQASEYIDDLPQGYDTEIGERGVGLSGGQKQRLAIARAIVLDPRVLILDDSLSAVDAETERALQASFATVMRGRTTVLIAHRLSTVQHADQIVVLKEGRIVEQGTHAELIQRSGYYKDVLDLQNMN